MEYTRLLDRGLLPDWIIRFGIRRLLRSRIREERRDGLEVQHRSVMDWVERLRRSPIAVDTQAANEQHYEVPAAFYERVLGHRLKYSCGLWGPDTQTLDDAEDAMLALCAERAQLADGQRVLDLGCGWGSFGLWIAERYPNSQVLAVSNSSSQREFILARARHRGLTNIEVMTRDVNELALDREFDRIVSVEMFEHVRNYRTLLERVASWLDNEGILFIHIFTHREFAYPFEVEGEDNWLGRHFFTGGQMPSDHLLLYFQEHVVIDDHWRVRGTHYAKTAEAWLRNFDSDRAFLRSVLEGACGADWRRMEVYWRVFFMACAELWKWNDGRDWFVSHYRFSKRAARDRCNEKILPTSAGRSADPGGSGACPGVMTPHPAHPLA
jgi:cyclopropane-fatty-acyl-phospholipid synthase